MWWDEYETLKGNELGLMQTHKNICWHGATNGKNVWWTYIIVKSVMTGNTSWYKMQCKCNMHKRKAIYMLQRSSHTQLKSKRTPSSPPRKRVKVAWSKVLVKISASWSCVGTWIKAIFHFSKLSLRKWYLTSMCLVLEWSTGFFATLMALVLSHRSGTWVYSSPKSLMVYVIQRSWEQQLATATYSTSVVDWATLDCLREDQDTKEEPKN
jgi:hypothetical protein